MVRYGLKICTWQTNVGRTSGYGDPYRIIISSMYSANYANPHQKTWTDGRSKPIKFSNESDAYKFMLENSNSVEQGAFITLNCVIVYVDYLNGSMSASWTKYGYKLVSNGDKYFTLTQNGKVISDKILAFVHTHTVNSYFSGEDINTSANNKSLPMVLLRNCFDPAFAYGKLYNGPLRGYNSERVVIPSRGVTNQTLIEGRVSLINYFNNIYKR